MNMKSLASILNRPLGKLVLGSAGGYAFVLVLSPVMTRVYTPEDFGQFAIFSSFVAVASVLMSMSLELGILSAKRRSEARRYVFLSVAAVVVMTALITVCLLLLYILGVDLRLPAWVLVLAVLSCAIASLTSIAINWSIYSQEPDLAARAVFLSLSGRSVMQVGLGYASGGILGLALGEIAGRLLALLAAAGGQLRSQFRLSNRNRRLTKTHLDAMRPYALYVTPSAAIDTALVWLPAPLFSIFFGPFAGGLVAMTQRFGSVPLTIANQSLGQIFHRRAAEKLGSDNGYLLRFIMLYFGGLLLLAAVAVFALAWGGDRLFGLLLGSAWSQTYIAAIALAPLYLFQFVSLLTNRIILVGGRANIKLASSIAQLCVLIATVAVAKWTNLSWEPALFAVAGCLALTQCLTILYVLHLLSHSRSTKRVVPTD